MESVVKAAFEAIITKGIFADTSLLLITICILVGLFKFILKPMYEKVKELPTSEDMDKAIEAKKEIDFERLEKLTKSMENISERLGEVQDLTRGGYRELKEVKRDIEHIKEILNQFQGHLMYRTHRNDEFGNRELK